MAPGACACYETAKSYTTGDPSGARREARAKGEEAMTLPYNKDEWRASVKNGEIPRNLLDETDPTQFDDDLGGPAIMHPEAAAAMSALLAHARRDGLQFRVRFSYRTLAKQQEKWRSFQMGAILLQPPVRPITVGLFLMT